MNRAEHLDWAKTRALAYVDQGDVKNAMASFVSDVDKHPGTAGIIVGAISMIGMSAAINDDPNEMRRWIEGFH